MAAAEKSKYAKRENMKWRRGGERKAANQAEEISGGA